MGFFVPIRRRALAREDGRSFSPAEAATARLIGLRPNSILRCRYDRFPLYYPGTTELHRLLAMIGLVPKLRG